MVSNRKGFIDASQLTLIEIHTHVSNDVAESLLPDNAKIVYHYTKQDAISRIYEGRAVLIPWEEWQDDLELIVVMNGNEKARDFRGAFLYNM